MATDLFVDDRVCNCHWFLLLAFECHVGVCGECDAEYLQQRSGRDCACQHPGTARLCSLPSQLLFFGRVCSHILELVSDHLDAGGVLVIFHSLCWWRKHSGQLSPLCGPAECRCSQQLLVVVWIVPLSKCGLVLVVCVQVFEWDRLHSNSGGDTDLCDGQPIVDVDLAARGAAMFVTSLF